jgi:hypothetical protein
MTHDFLPTPAPENTSACESNSNANSATQSLSVDQIQKHLESFAAFDRWMDEKLDELVAAWIHTAAPNASRVSRKGKR